MDSQPTEKRVKVDIKKALEKLIGRPLGQTDDASAASDASVQLVPHLDKEQITHFVEYFGDYTEETQLLYAMHFYACTECGRVFREVLKKYQERQTF